MMLTNNAPMIATGAERSVAELRLIFERASAKMDMRTAREIAEANETRVADVTTTEPELELEPESHPEPAGENDGNNESMSETDSDSDSELVHVLHVHEMRSILNDDVQESEPPKDEFGSVSETQSDGASDVAAAPSVSGEPKLDAAPAPSFLRPPQIKRSTARAAAVAPPPKPATAAAISSPAPETASSSRAQQQAKNNNNDRELARAQEWRANKKELDSRLAAAKPRYMDYQTSTRYIAHREGSIAQRQRKSSSSPRVNAAAAAAAVAATGRRSTSRTSATMRRSSA
ncbi:hypothetical protein P43SY_004662 [Pythium insidiosum]|uniref:Uncharacterized protein n=1 Tax=Pythium insidiosum TaxID=114742 RepID=A0AAD5Q4T7_PYTIN|nr:hypothetical protein P43SY_004662 [Pythium insidiosum]